MTISDETSMYEAEVSGKCPFCGLDVAFGLNPPFTHSTKTIGIEQ